jgi:uncharacterized membrane protein (UPF0127 family)
VRTIGRMTEWARVTNQTRGTLLTERCRIARSLKDRTIGLLGTNGLAAGHGLWIERSPSIHMFFMRYAIDVVFIDRHGRVVRVVENLRPWRIVAWVRGARDCIELPAGSVRPTGTVAGDVLTTQAVTGE